MAQHVIFLLHGAGSYTAEGKPDPQASWFVDAEKAIRDAFAGSPRLKNEKFDDWFLIEPVIYDDFFHKLVSEWEAGAKLYSPIFGAGTFGSTVINFFRDAAATEDNFLWANAADLFLYAAFGSASTLVRPAVIASVREQISAGLKKHRGKRWSVLAHSLGTAVAHDALAQMAKSQLFRLAGRAEVVAMVANLSKVLESETFGGKVYDSAVRPGRITENYISAVHRFDPISLFRQFAPPPQPGWTVQDGFDMVHELSHFVFDGKESALAKLSLTNPVTHSFSHYFAHPKVHLAFFQRAESWLGIEDSDINAAAVEFRKRQNASLESFVRARFDDITPGGGEGLSGFLDKLSLVMRRWR